MISTPRILPWFASCLLAIGHGLSAQSPAPTDDEKVQEAPYRLAWLLEDNGGVSFPITTKSDSARKLFNQGPAQFYAGSIMGSGRSFRQVLREDPACTMAFWGMALANQGNSARALKMLPSTGGQLPEMDSLLYSSLVQFYGALPEAGLPGEPAIKLAAVFAEIMRKFPEELEAKALWVHQVMRNRELFGIPIEEPAA